MKKIVVFCLLIVAWAAAQDSNQPPVSSHEHIVYDTLSSSDEVAGYTIQVWGNTETLASGTHLLYQALRIVSPVGAHYEMEAVKLRWEAEDINADGVIEVVITTFSGGANCCSRTVIVPLREDTLEPIFISPENAVVIELEDRDGDGIQELLDQDLVWLAYCPKAIAPKPMIIWAWDGKGFKVANRASYRGSLDRASLDRALADITEGKAYDPVCSLLEAVLPYLYDGEMDYARAMLDILYEPLAAVSVHDGYLWLDENENKEMLWQNIVVTAESSELYRAVVQSADE